MQTLNTEVMVFRTSVLNHESVDLLKPKLDALLGKRVWNFALDDCDKILRVCTSREDLSPTIRLLNEHGFECEELED